MANGSFLCDFIAADPFTGQATGKSQLTFYEYLNGITFGSIAANMATDDLANAPDHLVGLVTYGILTLRRIMAGAEKPQIPQGHGR